LREKIHEYKNKLPRTTSTVVASPSTTATSVASNTYPVQN
jgi:hypothetical protein